MPNLEEEVSAVQSKPLASREKPISLVNALVVPLGMIAVGGAIGYFAGKNFEPPHPYFGVFCGLIIGSLCCHGYQESVLGSNDSADGFLEP